MTLDELYALKRRLNEQKRQIDSVLADVQRSIQALCNHDWKWEQVAGEGRTCQKCGLRDYSND